MSKLYKTDFNLPKTEQLTAAQEVLERWTDSYRNGKNYLELEEELQAAASVFKRFEVHFDYTRCQKWLAQIYIDSQRLNQALKILKEGVIYAVQHLGKMNSEIGQLYDRLSRCYENLSDYPTACQYALKCLEIAEITQNKTDNPSYLWSVYMLLSTLYNKMGDANTSIVYAQKALSFGDTSWGKQGSSEKPWGDYYLNFANCCYHLSYTYKAKGDYANQLQYLKKGLKVVLDLLGENHLTTAFFYTPLAHYHRTNGELDISLMYHQKSLNIQKKHLPTTHWRVSSAHNNAGEVLFELNRYEDAFLHTEQALVALKKEFGSGHIRVANSLKTLGKIHFYLHRTKEAMDCMQQALQIIHENFGEVHPEVSTVYIELSKYSTVAKEKILFAQKAIEIQKKCVGDKHPQLSDYYLNMALYFFKSSNFSEAITAIQESLNSLFQDFFSRDILLLPPIKKTSSNLHLLSAIALKADILYHLYLENQEKNYLNASLKHYTKALELIHQIRQNYRTDFSKLKLLEVAANVCEGGIAASLFWQVEAKMELIFYFSENAKAVLLLAAQQDVFAKNKANISQAFQKRERQLKIELTYLEKNIQGEIAKGTKKNEELLQEWQNEFFNYHQEYLHFLQQLETDFPEYYQQKYDTQTTTPTELQFRLNKSQVVLSYFVGKEKLYIFVITSNEFEVIDLQLPNDFEALVQDFMDALTQHQLAAFREKSYQLYQLLIAPIRDFIVDDFGLDDEEEELKQVFVIPHGVLSYVPFEALVGQPLSRFSTVDKVTENSPTPEGFGDVWSGLDYLIHHCQISYHYSATLLYRHLLKKQTEEELEFPNSFAGFAPIYDVSIPSNSNTESKAEAKEEQPDLLQQSAKSMQAWATRSEAIRGDGTWVSLPHSETEAKGIAQLFEEKGLKSEIFLREKASKEGFAEAAKRFKFLLVAAHGLVNDEKTVLSGLVFYPKTVDDGRQTMDENVVENSPSFEKHGDIWNDERSEMSPSFTNVGESATIDNILSMEETHHLDLQADLVVLSSCESGIGTLHKGEGMMAVNRGFLAAGANNVVSTLFKVYDKPSSLLTQYLFEEVLKGKEYSAALRLAKLKLIQQLNIDPKSWSGFVLIGG